MQRRQGSVQEPVKERGVKFWISVIGGSIPILGGVFAASFWIDARYAHAEDFQRSMAQQNLITQESLIELRLEQNAFQTRSLKRRMSAGSETPELDKEEMADLRTNRESLQQRHHDVRMQLQMMQ